MSGTQQGNALSPIPQVGMANPLGVSAPPQQINPQLSMPNQQALQNIAQTSQNPYQPLGNMLGVQQQALANQTAQRTLMARQRIGQIQQQSINPQTGQVDWNKFAVGVAADPQASFLAPEAMQQAAQTQGVQLGDIAQTIKNASMHYGAIQQVGIGLLPKAQAGTATQSDFMNGLAKLVAQGVITADDAKQQMAAMAADGQPVSQQILQMTLQAGGAAKSLDETYGTIMNLNSGGKQFQVTASPLNGVRPLSTLTNTPSPAEMNAPTTVQTPGGAAKTQPLGQTEVMLNGAAQPIPGTGPASGGAGNTQALAPDVGTILQRYEPQLNDRVYQSQTTLQNYQQMLVDLEQVKSGGGGEARAKLAQMAQAMGMPPEVYNKIGNGDLAATQQFEKMATINAMQTLRSTSQTGPVSTEEFRIFDQTLPNISTDPKAAKMMLNYMAQLSELPGKEQDAYFRYKALYEKNPTQYPLERWPQVWNKIMQASGKIKLGAPGSLTAFAPPNAPQAAAQVPGSPTGGLPPGITPGPGGE